MDARLYKSQTCSSVSYITRQFEPQSVLTRLLPGWGVCLLPGLIHGLSSPWFIPGTTNTHLDHGGGYRVDAGVHRALIKRQGMRSHDVRPRVGTHRQTIILQASAQVMKPQSCSCPQPEASFVKDHTGVIASSHKSENITPT